MSEGLIKEHALLIKTFRKVSVKLQNYKSHPDFLEKCKNENVLPKGLNLIKLTTSPELWKANADQISKLLYTYSEGILKTHIEIKKSIIGDLQKQKNFLSNKLERVLTENKFIEEMSRVQSHVRNVQQLLESTKTNKFKRDKTESGTYSKYTSSKSKKKVRVRRPRSGKRKKQLPNEQIIEDPKIVVENREGLVEDLETNDSEMDEGESGNGDINSVSSESGSGDEDCNSVSSGSTSETVSSDSTSETFFEGMGEHSGASSEYLESSMEADASDTNSQNEENIESTTSGNNTVVEENIDHEISTDSYGSLGDSNIGRIFSNNYWDGMVKNLSSKGLEANKMKALALGPKMTLVQRDVNRGRLQKDLISGFRRLRLAEKNFPNVDNRTEEQKRFYIPKTDYTPPAGRNKKLDTYIDMVQFEFDHWNQIQRPKMNVPFQIEEAIVSLEHDDEIDIKMDDKSGSFVVADPETYHSAVLNDLEKCDQVEELPSNSDRKRIIRDIVSEINVSFWGNYRRNCKVHYSQGKRI